MSMITPKSRASSTHSSILKKSKSLSSRLSEINTSISKVRFVLPHSQRVRSILEEYAKTKISRDYENLVCLIRDSELTDDDLSGLLKEATECISILNQELRLFVEALLSVDWTGRENGVVKKYQSFIVNLLSAHNYHARIVIEKLVRFFLSDLAEHEWPDGVPSEEETNKCKNVHKLLNSLLIVVPMCKELLMSFLTNLYPYYNKATHIHEYYVHNLLRIVQDQPNFRPDILGLIFSKLVVLDVNAPREDIEKHREEEIFEMDNDAKSIKTTTTAFTQVNRNSIAHTLDVCLDMIFNYIITECHNIETGDLNWDKTRNLYIHMLPIFDKIILPTYNTHHVQYGMFLMCSFKTSVTEAFLNYLWNKVCNPNVAPILRQAAVNYIASLLARLNSIPLTMLKGTMQQMAEWIHSYIHNQDGLECVNSDVRVHSVFYSVCQALFYIVCFRYKDFVESKKAKKNLVFLESLNMAKMVTSRLNPLRVCQQAVVQNFSAITRNYQLAYCNTIIEHNARNTIPTIYQDEKGTVVTSNNILDAFYPFDPYVLERSGKKISPFYKEYEEIEENMEVDNEQTTSSSREADVDDFLFNHEQNTTPFSSGKASCKFSYGSSPGFKFKNY